MHKVTCIIVTYNASKWIYNCLNSIKEPNIDLNIIVIDNNSSDDTLKIITDNFSFVSVFPQKSNLGFAAANNLGYENSAGSDFIYLLNQDTISYPNNIFNLIEAASKNECLKYGFVSPLHLNDRGTELDKQFERYITADTSPRLISDAILNKKKEMYEIGFVNAAAWLLRSDTINDLGGLFSSAFFHYGEDRNFAGRLHYFNYKNFVVTNVFIHHCREERKGKISKQFRKKHVFINANIKLYDINSSLYSSIFWVYKYIFYEILKGEFVHAVKLFLLPIIRIRKIKKIRKSFITKKII